MAGVGEVAGAITASTLTSVCVFFPIVFVEEAGGAGQIFRDLALTVVVSPGLFYAGSHQEYCSNHS